VRQARQVYFENEAPCATVDFVFPGDNEPERTCEDEGQLRREILFRLLQFLTMRAGAKRIGQRALVLAFLAGAMPFKKQKQLATKLGVSAGRASQILKLAKAEFSKLAKPD
jgi:hypothetical protein